MVITTAAEDKNLLSAEEMRLAIGLASGDSSKDTPLATLNARVSTLIAQACKVATAGISVVTLRSETITETFRNGEWFEHLVLSRRPVTAITSVVEDGVTLAATDYEIDAGSGLLLRLEDDRPAMWSGEKITVVYVAGWATVPADLKLAASKVANEFYTVGTRDPNLKRVDVFEVVEREYWVSPKDDPLLSNEIQALLAPYMNMAVA